MRELKLNAGRVFRGGYCSGVASFLRAADRYYYSPSTQSDYISARLSPRFVRSKR